MLKANQTPLSLKEIVAQVSEEAIFKYYFQEVTSLRVVNPLRNDKRPGCNFYRTEKGTIKFKDWATGDN